MQNSFYTERLILKILSEPSADKVANYYCRNYDYLKQWQSKAMATMLNPETCAEDLKFEHAMMLSGDFLRLYVFKKEDLDTIIGTVSIFNIMRGSFDSCMIGYSMDESEQGKGYMPEALLYALEIMFNIFKIHRVEINIMPRNTRSRQVALKLGFREEGLAKGLFEINGVWEDHIRLALIKGEI